MASIPTPPQPGLAPLTLSPLQPSTAHLLSLGFACCYVGSLYIPNRARLKFETNLPARQEEVQERAKLAHERWRDDPDVIAARLKMASLASVFCVLGRQTAIDQICLVLFSKSCITTSVQDTSIAFLHSLWSTVQAAWYTLRPHVVLPLLFLGPLLATYLEGTLPFQRRWSWRYTKWRFCSLTGLRTFILGPITEEIVFRACVLAVSNMAHLSKKSMVLWTPLVFGVAHVHHAWDSFNRYGRTKRALKVALISTFIQFCYTSLFGFLVAYLFINSGSLYPPITAHMFCNTMGLPNPVEGVGRRRTGAGKIAIVVAYLVGIVGFYYALPVWSTYPNGSGGVWDRYSH
ncbi:hypothetical protein BKA70DRAFT_1104644 [Coprinopsis sp. MPI-PUGE-AT-0042]|nr:hypothetical protein BKA70DRAFT_1104644 [Coprinopsis sp. MPI-PUGE-AT-0042]